MRTSTGRGGWSVSENYLVFDIETDALLDEVTTIACICTRDQDGVESVYHDHPRLLRHGTIEDGLWELVDQSLLVAHNGQGFDIPVIEKLFPEVDPGWPPLYDTAIASRLHYPDLRAADSRSGKVSKELRGSHKLAAWGERLGLHKGTEDVSEGVKVLTQDIIDYCLQDCRVTDRLYQRLLQDKWPEESTKLEHEFAKCLNDMQRRGVCFDEEQADRLVKELTVERAKLDDVIANAFPPWEKQLKTKVKIIPFNPNSRDHISRFFQEKYDWEPKLYTDTGKPQVDEKVLGSLEYPEAKLLARRFLVQKRLGQIAEGDNAWLNFVKDGRVHGGVIHNGTVTGRCAHFKPNLGQVPAVDAPWGTECRSCFIPSPGMVMVGADASGLELRMLAHYMADDGFIEALIEGDIHARNTEALGLPPESRPLAKRFIYAYLYGAGLEKLAEVLTCSVKEAKATKARFESNTPKLKALKAAVASAAKRGFLIGLDGRRVPVRSPHSALNTLLQSAGAVVMKKATVHACFATGGKANLLLMVHDEFQFETAFPEFTGTNAVHAIELAGRELDLKVPLTGEYKIGSSWAETH